MPDRRLTYMPLDDITPASRNPKGHDVDGIQASIGRFGYVAPSVIDERTGRLVAGHGRIDALRAMRDAGQDPPAGVRLAAGGTWQLPVLRGWASRSDAEADAYLVADNEWTVKGAWNDGELGELLSDLVAADPDLLATTGFTDADLATLLADGDSDSRPEPVLPPIPEHPVTRTGDVWTLGRHRLHCGDYADLIGMPGVIGEQAIIYADPPYGVGYIRKEGNPRHGGRVSGGSVERTIVSTAPYPAAGTGDDTPASAGAAFTAYVSAHPAASHIWWGANHYAASARLPNASCWLVWNKDNGDSNFADAEIAWTNYPGAIRMLEHRWCGLVRDSERGPRFHPTQKPVALAEWAFSVVDKRNERTTVLDPFAGSGSALLAAEETGRAAIAIEIEPAYCDVICRRFQQATGVLPERDGQPHDFTEGGSDG